MFSLCNCEHVGEFNPTDHSSGLSCVDRAIFFFCISQFVLLLKDRASFWNTLFIFHWFWSGFSVKTLKHA